MNRIITAISILLASAPLGGMASATMLVENGQPRAEIVIAEQPARMARLAAEELQTYIEKISGARLPIVTEPSGEAARIFVGVSPHTEALGLDTEGLKHGAFRMVSGDAPTDDAPWHINLGRNRPRGADQPRFFALQPSGEQRFHNRFIRASVAAEPRE